jgi:hypothetical protein
MRPNHGYVRALRKVGVGLLIAATTVVLYFVLRGGITTGGFNIATKSGESTTVISQGDANALISGKGATPLLLQDLAPQATSCTKVINAAEDVLLVCAPENLGGAEPVDGTYDVRAADLVALSDRLTSDPNAKAVIVTTLDPSLADHRKSISQQGALVLDFVSPVNFGDHQVPGFSALSKKGIEWFGYGDSGGTKILLWAWARDLTSLNSLLAFR